MLSKPTKPATNAAADQLKDFQNATVQHVLHRMQQGQQRFLIADEVGLGKTIVAKGIIEKLLAAHRKKKPFTVVYICSNQVLARQNIRKLQVEGLQLSENQHHDRLTSLAYAATKQEGHGGILQTLTPKTSFHTDGFLGRADERILLYRLLYGLTEMNYQRGKLAKFLQGSMGEKSWNDSVNKAEGAEKKRKADRQPQPDDEPIREELYGLFEKAISKPKGQFAPVGTKQSLLEELLTVLKKFTSEKTTWKNNRDLIGRLRTCLTDCCAAFLQADLFILDEFQRFGTLISTGEPKSDADELAQKVLGQKQAKVLLLSATPFKAYTTLAEEQEGDSHFQEFKKVIRFLQAKQVEAIGIDQSKNDPLSTAQKLYLQALQPKFEGRLDVESAGTHKAELEDIYTRFMARTERSLVAAKQRPDSRAQKILYVEAEDVEDFVALDEIVRLHNAKSNGSQLSNTLEYVKSAPFALSFLQDYDHAQLVEGKMEALTDKIDQSPRLLLPQKAVLSYAPLLSKRKVEQSNAKLRFLYEQMVQRHQAELLWVPPSLRYYEPQAGCFAKESSFSKVLVFSAWKLVPRMISTLVSYEAERLSVGRWIQIQKAAEAAGISKRINKKTALTNPLAKFPENYANGTDSFKQKLPNYRLDVRSMHHFMLAWPSPFLAKHYHPATNLGRKFSLPKLLFELNKSLRKELKNASKKHGIGSNVPNDWWSVLLLDKHGENAEPGTILQWLNGFSAQADASDETNDDTGHQKAPDQKGLQECVDVLTDFFAKEGPQHVLTAKSEEEVLGHLAKLCIGAPGTAAYRALAAAFPADAAHKVLAAAFEVGLGIISLFNKPESIAVVRNASKAEEAYHLDVLEYCVQGNIQAMLDEFVHQLQGSGRFATAAEMALHLRSVLSMPAVNANVFTKETITSGEPFKMRCHYALAFANGQRQDERSNRRQASVQDAFNSPFRPFVLATTSIGQEGLDFHHYCSKIIHWNLPHNPIDLEQREGRINRFKSLAVRREVANVCGGHLSSTEVGTNVWDQLFALAGNHKSEAHKEQFTCDLIPFWQFGNSNIQSTALLYHYSRDLARYDYIRQVLLLYRLTFGQPHQQDLVDLLAASSKEDQQAALSLTLNLSPITRDGDLSKQKTPQFS